MNEIQRPTAARVDSVIATSIGTAVVTYCTVALCGYFTFGEGVAGDVLDNYPEGAPVVTVARVFVATLVALTYPLQCHPARACILSLLSSRRFFRARVLWIFSGFFASNTHTRCRHLRNPSVARRLSSLPGPSLAKNNSQRHKPQACKSGRETRTC